MKIKFNKKIAIMASSIVLVESAIYAGFVGFTKKKPFSENEYEFHKVILDTDNKDLEKEFYVSDKLGFKSAIIVKTPYKIDNNQKYECEIVAIDAARFSLEKIDDIKKCDQDTLLKDSYIQKKLEKINDLDNKLLSYDTVSKLPDDNNYELSYSTITEDFSDTRMLPDEAKDFKNTINYLMFSGFGAAITIPAIKKLTKKKLK